MAANVVTLTTANFDETIRSANTPVLVDFWAEWCGPCKMIAPILDEIAKDMQGKVTVAKLNVDEDSAVAQRFNIRGIPTLILFKDGKEVAQQVGAVSKSQLLKFLQQNVG